MLNKSGVSKLAHLKYWLSAQHDHQTGGCFKDDGIFLSMVRRTNPPMITFAETKINGMVKKNKTNHDDGAVTQKAMKHLINLGLFSQKFILN